MSVENQETSDKNSFSLFNVASELSVGHECRLLSTRSEAWRLAKHQDRCGMCPFVFSPDFCFDSYVEWAMDVPMLWMYRDGRFINPGGRQTFRDFMEGRLDVMPGAIREL